MCIRSTDIDNDTHNDNYNDKTMKLVILTTRLMTVMIQLLCNYY